MISFCKLLSTSVYITKDNDPCDDKWESICVLISMGSTGGLGNRGMSTLVRIYLCQLKLSAPMNEYNGQS